MAIRLELTNLIILLKNINYCYPGGFDLFSKHNASMFGETFCHDALLFRAGATDFHDIENLLLYWQQRGLVPYVEIDGIKQWKDTGFQVPVAHNVFKVCDTSDEKAWIMPPTIDTVMLLQPVAGKIRNARVVNHNSWYRGF